MEKVRIIEIKESVFADNDREAARLRAKLKREKTFLLNLMSSPGSGKTTLLLRTIEALKEKLRIGVGSRYRFGGGCGNGRHHRGKDHSDPYRRDVPLDAGMTERGLQELGTADLDLVILENVGNLSARLSLIPAR